MSIERLWNLEGRVERLSNALGRLAAQVAGLSQQAWQMARPPGGGGGGGLIPITLPTGIAAGSPGSPSSATDAIRMVPIASPPGFTTVNGVNETVYSMYTTAVSGTNKFGYAIRGEDSNLYLVVADC